MTCNNYIGKGSCLYFHYFCVLTLSVFVVSCGSPFEIVDYYELESQATQEENAENGANQGNGTNQGNGETESASPPAGVSTSSIGTASHFAPVVVVKEGFFTITNDFQDHLGLSPIYMHLKSVSTGRTYIVPPTQYSSLELDHIIINLKVEGDSCLQVPKEDFPLEIGVCKTKECTSVRPLEVILTNPGHYNLGGVGGLFVPQLYPVSTCSSEFVNLIKDLKSYQDL